MKSEAIVEYGQPLQIIESATPEPKGTEVLLKVTHCGVCHSDVHIHDGHFDMGVYAEVLNDGVISVGDPVELLDA